MSSPPTLSLFIFPALPGLPRAQLGPPRLASRPLVGRTVRPRPVLLAKAAGTPSEPEDQFTWLPDPLNTAVPPPVDLQEYTMRLHKKNAAKGGAKNPELMPFDVKVSSPPPRELGCFKLDPKTHCGDSLEYKGIFYVVKRIKVQYEYKNGGYEVVRKAVEVKTLNRKAIEQGLERMYSSENSDGV